jgi:hypothetical protein
MVGTSDRLLVEFDGDFSAEFYREGTVAKGIDFGQTSRHFFEERG